MTIWISFSQTKNNHHLLTNGLESDLFISFSLNIESKINIHITLNKQYQYPSSKQAFLKALGKILEKDFQSSYDYQITTTNCDLSKKIVELVHKFANFRSWERDSMMQQISDFYINKRNTTPIHNIKCTEPCEMSTLEDTQRPLQKTSLNSSNASSLNSPSQKEISPTLPSVSNNPYSSFSSTMNTKRLDDNILDTAKKSVRLNIRNIINESTTVAYQNHWDSKKQTCRTIITVSFKHEQDAKTVRDLMFNFFNYGSTSEEGEQRKVNYHGLTTHDDGTPNILMYSEEYDNFMGLGATQRLILGKDNNTPAYNENNNAISFKKGYNK